MSTSDNFIRFKKLIDEHLKEWSEESRNEIERIIADSPYFEELEFVKLDCNSPQSYGNRYWWRVSHYSTCLNMNFVLKEESSVISFRNRMNSLNKEIEQYMKEEQLVRESMRDADCDVVEKYGQRKKCFDNSFGLENSIRQWIDKKERETMPVFCPVSLYNLLGALYDPYLINSYNVWDDLCYIEKLWRVLASSDYIEKSYINYDKTKRQTRGISFTTGYKVVIHNNELGVSCGFTIKLDESASMAISRISQVVERFDLKCAVEEQKKKVKSINEEIEEKQQKQNRFLYNEIAIVNRFIKQNSTVTTKMINDYISKIDMSFIDFDPKVTIQQNKEYSKLVLDLLVPTIENFSTISKAIYRNDEINYQYFSKKIVNEQYERFIYSYVLLCFYLVFKSNEKRLNAIEDVVLNGYVCVTEKTTGKKIEPFILSVESTYETFKNVVVEKVDPKEWFKAQKGIVAAKIETVTPVAPIMGINRMDKRFVDAVNVEIDNSTNLAAIDWKEFENLIRELFEKEFKQYGGEVKVTQASRDGGVDAVAFDPDPIRGGKIIIQAKRYTNIVGVSAVRDLYGTVLNEGANKGVLVTTSDYGSDSYEFAKGKPITLLNGANLLFLLNKHGYEAKIDIEEARKVN